MPTHHIQALLFDLGGVLIDVDFNRVLEYWQPISRLTIEELKATFSSDLPYQQHERGEITAAQYFAHLAVNLELQDDLAHITQGWNAIFGGEITETLNLVREARAHLPCYVFSNTNATHQAVWTALYPSLAQSFERIFVSSEIGYRKPERRAFEYVANAMGVPLDAILFFDDHPDNVEGARAAGLQAVQVRGPADVRAALQRIGCVA
ncbi:HAD-IA family hydrolase [Polaromonas aquatica]|uniref:HAD-IA family hydrolase n=1 Tax=Polaromonas aquatica TaxID=332657 RepID=UPI003D64C402